MPWRNQCNQTPAFPSEKGMEGVVNDDILMNTVDQVNASGTLHGRPLILGGTMPGWAMMSVTRSPNILGMPEASGHLIVRGPRSGTSLSADILYRINLRHSKINAIQPERQTDSPMVKWTMRWTKILFHRRTLNAAAKRKSTYPIQ
ncbi:hypothetical protein FIBSPDRAFT_939326 [Athelia psychrophila]|uniref:Uncharacterized protein n=1 Tax=Athelia psychrophila TaxID=1759441 RepID=A0A165WPC7_9AGAM|nr:hypothetical protein FIBSPDRAFT_939326 [Fibularhizoctonia sp. CBS 109695]